jgi:hypothetical protein
MTKVQLNRLDQLNLINPLIALDSGRGKGKEDVVEIP